MRQQYRLVYLVLLFISEYQTQESTTTSLLSDWNGDPNLCTVNSSTTPSPTNASLLPIFTNQAEFVLEVVEIRHRSNQTISREMTMYHYIYNYDANTLIRVENKNDFVNVEYYYYNILKKSTYFNGDRCDLTDIPIDIDIDGKSAIRLPNGTTHIRPMNEFLLFSSNDSSRQVTPVYLGKDVVRGIPVDKWQTCYINKAQYRTVRRIWTFAQQGIIMPTGLVSDFAVPIQALISSSIVFSNGTQAAEVDEVFNVVSFRPNITKTNYVLSLPKGVFCNCSSDQKLISLEDVGISWPNRFSIRVEVLTSHSTQWQRFHLRFDQGSDGTSRRLRYDYMPPGTEDFESVIHDYGDDLIYIIDRRIGTCKINHGIDIPDVDPIRDPIRFFIKNEANFIFNPPKNAWEYNKYYGLRSCRGDTIKCTILTTLIDKFPAIVSPDTGKPTGEMWDGTNIEYGWAIRAPNAQSSLNATKQFDYPVSLYLKMYRYEDPTDPSSSNIYTEDIEYEFYEMSQERYSSDFDISICYRSLNYEYLHLVFILEFNKDNIIDGNHLDRSQLEDQIHLNLINIMQIRSSRITDLEIDHERISNDVTVFFTILGQTPRPESQSNFTDDERTAVQARDSLQQAIDDGQYEFEMKLDDDSVVIFRAKPNSLKGSKQYMSIHTSGKQVVNESYTIGSQILPILVGLLVGILLGIILTAIIRIVQKKPMPSLPIIASKPLPTVTFHLKKSTDTTSDI